MEGITRSLFQPILVQQTEGVNITRMVANMNEVYALDAALNRVLRLELSGNTYTLDDTFNCSSGTHDVRIVRRPWWISSSCQLTARWGNCAGSG